MESQGSVKRKYEKLLNDVATQDYYKKDLTNRVNCYVCKTCGHVTKTKDIDAGATPMIINCEQCSKDANSMFYNDVAPAKIPTIEWYRPSLKETLRLRKKPAYLEHVLSGGLLSRKIKTN